QAGTRVSPRTMVPSVGVMALEVRFGVRNDAKMVPSVPRCFPNVETLHIKVKSLTLLLSSICAMFCI
uniref:F-box/LRR-repeat protein 15/At3g58940/PEG3-like LRR domain-containing protein n=1 Tax=Aegilops tauschii subsp. strangulata TaxID=200361 RepID=A0A453N967_AEGTS